MIFFYTACLIFSAFGGFARHVITNPHDLYFLLILFVIADYITGSIKATSYRNYSINTGLEGIAKKIFIFAIVGACNLIDHTCQFSLFMTRDAVCCFFLFKELFSIFRNLDRILMKGLNDNDNTRLA